jgi:hypothetical protein
LEPEQKLLEVVEAVERGHRPRESAGGRPVDPPDSRPERGLGETAEEAELEQHTVDPAARENHGDVASFGLGHEGYCAPVESELRPGAAVLSDVDLESDEELWQGDDDGDHGGWFCVRTDPFPCPAEGCSFVADFMTAAHLVLVWEERDDPNLLWHAQRAKEVGRNPRIVGYEPGFGPSASYYAWEAAGRPVHGVKR